ncbi:archaemetzincin family Zn-dependent metalloprotease [Candidatus Aerophobetes bacterium]|nr:archaemetzincin family Zn-dependent metalloprotease [Candidatus Aerophobetes bacterium]
MFEKKRMICLVPIGEVEEDIIFHLGRGIREVFPLFQVRIEKVIPLPQQAYEKRRGQFKAEVILETISQLKLKEAEKILGVVDVDLYANGLNFVFGQAIYGGRDALISLFRLKNSLYGLVEDKNIYRLRALKEAIHELGHTFGLSHCPHIKCVMHFSNSIIDTDYKEKDFCKRCLASLSFYFFTSSP